MKATIDVLMGGHIPVCVNIEMPTQYWRVFWGKATEDAPDPSLDDLLLGISQAIGFKRSSRYGDDPHWRVE